MYGLGYIWVSHETIPLYSIALIGVVVFPQVEAGDVIVTVNDVDVLKYSIKEGKCNDVDVDDFRRL